MNKPMDRVRGTIVLADQVYQTTDGKWVIAGVYHHWITSNSTLVLTGGLHCFICFQVEKPGVFPVRVLMFDRLQPPTEKPILQVTSVVQVLDPNSPVALRIKLPQFKIKSPVPPKRIRRRKPVGIRLTLWLQIDGMDVASTPLNVIFRNPKDAHDANPNPPAPPPNPTPPSDSAGPSAPA